MVKPTKSVGAKGRSHGRAQKPKQKTKQGKSAAAGTMRAILDEESDEDDDNEENDDEEEGEGQEEDTSEESDNGGSPDEETTHLTNTDDDDESHASSAEFMLAEVTHHPDRHNKSSKNKSSDFPIPLPLIHRIMQSQFTTPEKTSLSTDARSLLGKYVEAFVREGIRRCVHERVEREKGVGANGGDGSDTGWLEVEDLERVGVQLCLDF